MGLLITLDALTQIGMVKTGSYTILDMGQFTSKIWISIIAFISIALLMSRKVKGAFIIGVVFGSIAYWIGHTDELPESIIIRRSDIHCISPLEWTYWGDTSKVLRLVVDLLFIGNIYLRPFNVFYGQSYCSLGVILLNGLAHGLSDMAGLKRSDGTIPRGKWLYAFCGIGTIIGSLTGAGPLLLSPESAPGIHIICFCCGLRSNPLY